MGMGPELLGAVSGSAAGGALGNMMGGGGSDGVDIDQVLAQYNQVLDDALGKAIQSVTQGTNQATGQLNQSLGTATNILNNATGQAGQTATDYTNRGFNMGQNLNTPYREAGYNANDALMQSMGLFTPLGGSSKAVRQGQYGQQAQDLLKQYGGKAPTNPGEFNVAAPGAFQATGTAAWTQQDINNQVAQRMQAESAAFDQRMANAAAHGAPRGNPAEEARSKQQYLASLQPTITQQIQQQIPAALAQQQAAYQQNVVNPYNQQKSEYDKNLGTYNAYTKSYQDLIDQGYSPDYAAQNAAAQEAFNSGGSTSGGSGGTSGGGVSSNNPLSGFYKSAQFKNLYGDTPQSTDPLTNFQNTGAFKNLYGDQAQTGDTLENFYNSPGYKLLFGEGNNQADPTQRFKFDPGYQFAQDEAAKQLQRQYASKGLLESGPMLQELQKQAQGMADQNYQRWSGQQSQLFNTDQSTRNALYQADQAQRGGLLNNHQTQLKDMSALGSQMTGANTAASMYGNLGSLLSGQQYGTGNTLFGGNMQVGSDIAGLLANLGVYTGNAQLSTGAAQGQGLWNALNASMQAQNNAAASQAGSMNAQNANQGYLQGARLLSGGNGYNGYQQPQSFSGGKPFNVQIGPGGSF